MNLIETIINNLSQNKFDNSGEYKLLIKQTILQHRDCNRFCSSITSSLNSLKIIDYQVTTKIVAYSTVFEYRCVLTIGYADYSYDLRLKAYNLEGLQEESLLLNYVNMAEVPVIFDMMDKVYTSLEETDIGDVTLKTRRIKQAILDAYKKEHKDVLLSTRNRLRSEAHILMCSDDMKKHVDSKRRANIRKGVMSCLRQARRMGYPDDIRYFLGELEVEEIMES